MKKFYQVVGKLFMLALGFVGVIMITSVIVLTYYEDEKEVLFWEINEYFTAMEEEIAEGNGIFNSNNIPSGDEITNI